MADSLDDKANGKEPKIDVEKVDNQDNLKQRHNVCKDIMPDLYSDVAGKDPKTSSP